MVVQLDPAEVAELERQFALPAAPEPVPPEEGVSTQGAVRKLIESIMPAGYDPFGMMLSIPLVTALDLRGHAHGPVQPDWTALECYLVGGCEKQRIAMIHDRAQAFLNRGTLHPLTTAQLRVLTAADTLLADPDAWITHSEGVDTFGQSVYPWESGAVRWCAIGALKRITHTVNDGDDIYCALRGWLDTIGMGLFGKASITQVNDENGYGAVRMVFGATRALFQVPRG